MHPEIKLPEQTAPKLPRNVQKVRRGSNSSSPYLQFRARFNVQGRDIVGPSRDTPEEASIDAEKLRSAICTDLGTEGTLAFALNLYIADARLRGVLPLTIRQGYRSAAASILQFWTPDAPLSAIDRLEVEAFVHAALAAGRSPYTVRAKYLSTLDAAFRIAGVKSPVPEVRSRMRGVLNARALPTRAPSFEEIAAAMVRIRTEEFSHTLRGHTKATPYYNRERVAALVEFLATTGIRGGEMGRLEVRDIDLERGVVAIREAKDRSNPRSIPIPFRTLAAARLLVEHARGGRIIPGGMVGISCTLKRWSKRLDLPWLSARQLRHAYATALASGGASLGAVMQGLGHKNPRTAQHYIDTTRGGLANFSDALGELLHEEQAQRSADADAVPEAAHALAGSAS